MHFSPVSLTSLNIPWGEDLFSCFIRCSERLHSCPRTIQLALIPKLTPSSTIELPAEVLGSILSREAGFEGKDIPITSLCLSDLQFRYKEAFLRDRGLQIGYRSINDDPRMRHFLRVGRLQSDNEYRKDFAKARSQFHSRADQPGFLQAKRSQQLASDVLYRQPLPQHTSDPEQLGLKHARKAHQLQSDVSLPPRTPCHIPGEQAEKANDSHSQLGHTCAKGCLRIGWRGPSSPSAAFITDKKPKPGELAT